MIVQSGNWSGRDPNNEIPESGVINSGNFSQLQPYTQIMSGKTLTINGGNWINVSGDPNWTINGGNWAQIDRCYHLHENLDLPAEVENCRHVVNTDEIYIDGQLITTVYHREDRVL